MVPKLSGLALLAAGALALSSLLACDGRTLPVEYDIGVTDSGPLTDGIPPRTDGPRRDGPRVDRGRDTGKPGKDLFPWPDKKLKPDQKITPDKALPPDKGVKLDKGPGPCNALGTTCAADKDCCAGNTCAKAFTGARFCSKQCTPDNPNTPLVNEDNCPGTPMVNICANIASSPGKTYRCVRRCVPTQGKNTCPSGLACEVKSTWMTVSVDQAICSFPACTSDKQCPVYFSKLCSTITPVNQCAGLPSGTFCAPHYPGSLGGRCAQPGKCEASSGLCVPHTKGKAGAKVGDTCIRDQDCGGQMECMMEVATSGTTYFRNGYCAVEGCVFGKTFTGRACPSGSTCSRIYYGGRCLKSCDLKVASSCRGVAKDKHGDYECRAWHTYLKTGGTLAKTAVCEPGHTMQCSYFSNSKVTCAALGLVGNSTQMACRQPGTGKLLATHSPNGYCLDITASGK